MENQTIEKELKTLEKIDNTNRKFMLPPTLKPCVVLIMQDSFEKGESFPRDRVAYLIATELRRVGESQDKAEKVLNSWDRKNKPPLGSMRIRSKIKSAYQKDYTFGCNVEPVMLHYCEQIGNQENCFYYKQAIGKDRITGSDLDFVKYGWPEILLPAERCIYFIGIISLEKLRRMRAGSTLFVSQRQIVKVSGVSLSKVGKALNSLRDYGLIDYKAGEPYRWRRKAGEIKRIIPIPKPLTCYKKGTATATKRKHIIEQQYRLGKHEGACKEDSKGNLT